MARILIALFILILFPVISAASVELKSEFDQGETLMATISGDFVEPLARENVLLYRGHVRIPLDVEIIKIKDTYYVYAQLFDKTEGNYSLRLENAIYVILNNIIEEDIIKNFTITNRTADFSVDPGFVVTETSFSIGMQNFKDSGITINIIENQTSKEESNKSAGFFGFFSEDEEQAQEGDSVSIGAFQSREVIFNITNITKTTLKTIELNTANTKYEIPVYVIIKGVASEEPKKRNFVFSPVETSVSMATGSTTNRIFYLYNNGEADLEDIEILVSDSIAPYTSISREFVDELEANESVKITLTFDSDYSEIIIEGDIIADASGLFTYIAVSLNFINDYEPPPGEEDEEIPPKDPAAVLGTCQELGGEICSENQKCSEGTEIAHDGNCCLAECVEKETGGSKGKVIGWTIIIAAVIFVFWFFKTKYRGAKKKVDLLKIAKGKK